MSYTHNIPNSSDARAESQIQILSNFQTLNSVWSVNHTPLTSTESQGQHKVLTMRNQTVDPTTAANQVALYNKLVSSIPELFFRPASNGTPIQLTYPSYTTGNPTVVVVAGPTGYTNYIWQTFVPGPFVIYAGYITNPLPTGLQNINSVQLSPVSNLLYVNANQSAQGVVTGNLTGATATGLNGAGPGSFQLIISGVVNAKCTVAYYFAIGQ